MLCKTDKIILLILKKSLSKEKTQFCAILLFWFFFGILYGVSNICVYRCSMCWQLFECFEKSLDISGFMPKRHGHSGKFYQIPQLVTDRLAI